MRLIIASFLAFIFPVFSIASNLPDLGQSSSSSLTSWQTDSLRKQIWREIVEHPRYIADSLITDYLNTLGAQLLSSAQQQGFSLKSITIFVMRDAQINAFALPGNLIGVNTGLILATRTESELAAVLAHEIAHLLQNHHARNQEEQKKISLSALSGLLLGAVAGIAASSANLGAALAVGGQAYSIDQQLSFSRNAEREADHIGFELLKNQYDPYALSSFFHRLVRANSVNEISVPVYMRTHPLNAERIAHLQTSAQALEYRQPIQSPEYAFIQARVRVLHETTPGGYLRVAQNLAADIQQKTAPYPAAAWYGIALAQFLQKQFKAAQQSLEHAWHNFHTQQSLCLIILRSQLLLKDKQQMNTAIDLLKNAEQKFLSSTALKEAYIQALFSAQHYAIAIDFLKQQTEWQKQNALWWKLLAQAYALTQNPVAQYQAMAKLYSIQQEWALALQQLERVLETMKKNKNQSIDQKIYFEQLSIIEAQRQEIKREIQKQQGIKY